jgi:hypothetical protein
MRPFPTKTSRDELRGMFSRNHPASSRLKDRIRTTCMPMPLSESRMSKLLILNGDMDSTRHGNIKERLPTRITSGLPGVSWEFIIDLIFSQDNPRNGVINLQRSCRNRHDWFFQRLIRHLSHVLLDEQDNKAVSYILPGLKREIQTLRT